MHNANISDIHDLPNPNPNLTFTQTQTTVLKPK